MIEAAKAVSVKQPSHLELELSLPSEQIISHGWYHGALSRQGAESLLKEERQFLVRDSSSQPYNYVLSCYSNRQCLHFVIQRVVVGICTIYESFRYQFEDEAYDTVASLITAYVTSGKPISTASGARIQYPVNRTKALRDSIPNPSFITSANVNTYSNLSPFNAYSNIVSKQSLVRNKTQRSHSLTPLNMHIQSKFASSSADGAIEYRGRSSENSSGLKWDHLSTLDQTHPQKMLYVNENIAITDSDKANQVSGSDSGNGSGDSNTTGILADQRLTSSKPEPSTSTSKEINLEELILQGSSDRSTLLESRLHFDSFESRIISPGLNKPFESETLHTIKVLLRTSGSRILASHLTYVDFNFLMEEIENVPDAPDKKLTVLELSLTPQGELIRNDIIDRIETLRLLVAVTILTCQTNVQRADVMNDWILLAVETKTALGNLNSFAGIMFGLCMPKIQNLEQAWSILRQEHTDNAFTYDAKLKPSFHYMNNGTYDLPPNTTIPYILPAVIAYQNLSGDECEEFDGADNEFQKYLISAMTYDARTARAHFSLSSQEPTRIEMFKRNARCVLPGEGKRDELLVELFRTEFQAMFLWGQKGMRNKSKSKYLRLIEIIASMSDRIVANQFD